MPTRNEALLDASLIHAVRMLRVRNGISRDVLLHLNNVILPPVHSTATALISRLVISGYSGPEITRALQALREASQDGYQDLYDLLRDALVPVAIAEAAWIRGQFPGMTTAKGLNAVVTSLPFEGRTLRQWTNTLQQTLLQDVRDQFVIGLRQGDSSTALERRLVGLSRDRGRGGVYGKQRRTARSVANTAFIHVTSGAREAFLEENVESFQGVMWLAQLDHATCPECGLLDGQIWAVGEGPRPPAHHQCRCWTTPVLRGIALPDSPTFVDWLRGQAVVVQDEVLGVKKAQLWRQGKLQFRDFVDSDGAILRLDQVAEL